MSKSQIDRYKDKHRHIQSKTNKNNVKPMEHMYLNSTL